MAAVRPLYRSLLLSLLLVTPNLAHAQTQADTACSVSEGAVRARTRSGTAGGVLGAVLGAGLGFGAGFAYEARNGANLEGGGIRTSMVLSTAIGGLIGTFVGVRLGRVTPEKAERRLRQECARRAAPAGSTAGPRLGLRPPAAVPFIDPGERGLEGPPKPLADSVRAP